MLRDASAPGRGEDRAVRRGGGRGSPVPPGGPRRPGRLRPARRARTGGVRRRGRRRARHGHRDRGGGPRLRQLLPDPRREQAGLAPGDPLRLRGAEEEVPDARWPRATAMFSYCLSEPDAGSDAAGMKTKAVRDGDFYVLNGVKRWITNAGESEYYTVMAVTDPDEALQGHLRLRRREVRRGRLLRRPGEEARHQGLARRARSTSTTFASRPTA